MIFGNQPWQPLVLTAYTIIPAVLAVQKVCVALNYLPFRMYRDFADFSHTVLSQVLATNQLNKGTALIAFFANSVAIIEAFGKNEH